MVQHGEWLVRVAPVDLAKRLGLSKQAISWRVKKALEKNWLVNDGPRTRRPYRLRRGQPLPTRASLPHPHHVEYAFFGVPRPSVNMQFLGFVTTVTSKWPEGFSVAELAASQPAAPQAVRERLDILVEAGLLVHDPETDRYGILFWAAPA